MIEMYLAEDGKRELLSPLRTETTVIKRRGKGIDLSLMGLSAEDGRDMNKREKLRGLLKGKKMSKKKVMRNK